MEFALKGTPEELAKIEIGPINCELTGPVQIIVNYV